MGRRGDVRCARAVVLAAGGFEADPARRALHLGAELGRGEGARHAVQHRRGARRRARRRRAAPTALERLPQHRLGRRGAADRRPRADQPAARASPIRSASSSTARGERFLDEGADFRNYTYAEVRRARSCASPARVAFQLFDARTAPLLRPQEYDAPGVSRRAGRHASASWPTALGVDRGGGWSAPSREFNAAITAATFDPAVKDGKRRAGVEPPKSNWALAARRSRRSTAIAVTCGITFTFGGVHVRRRRARARPRGPADRRACSRRASWSAGCSTDNYPGGSGLTAGAVFGRRAGASAAALAAGREAEAA